jgi:hypothetical protein
MTATLTGVQLVMAPSAKYRSSNFTGAKAAGMAVLATMACAAGPSDIGPRRCRRRRHGQEHGPVQELQENTANGGTRLMKWLLAAGWLGSWQHIWNPFVAQVDTDQDHADIFLTRLTGVR